VLLRFCPKIQTTKGSKSRFEMTHGHVSISQTLVYPLLPDEDMTKSKGKDPLEGLGGPMTRARARKAKKSLQQVLSILFEYKPKFQGEKSKVVSCIMAQMEED